MDSNYGLYKEPWPWSEEPAKTPRERELQLQLEIQQTCLETVREATRLAELEERGREERGGAR